MLTDEEKIYLLNSWLNNLEFHIDSLKKSIKDYPDSDISEKSKRSDILNDLIDKKTFYTQQLQLLAGNQ